MTVVLSQFNRTLQFWIEPLKLKPQSELISILGNLYVGFSIVLTNKRQFSEEPGCFERVQLPINGCWHHYLSHNAMYQIQE